MINQSFGFLTMFGDVILEFLEIFSFSPFLCSIVHMLNHNFRAATKIVRADLRLTSLKADQVLIKVLYAGVNASDVCTQVPSPKYPLQLS